MVILAIYGGLTWSTLTKEKQLWKRFTLWCLTLTNAATQHPDGSVTIARPDRVNHRGFTITRTQEHNALWTIQSDNETVPRELQSNYTGLNTAKRAIDVFLSKVEHGNG